jgi:hypothetical protein
VPRGRESVRRSRAILIGLVVAAGCVSPAITTASPTIVVQQSASPSPSALPAPVLNDRFGFIVVDPGLPRLVVRRESAPQPIFELAAFDALAVAPNGRRVASIVDKKIHVLEVAANAQPRVVFDPSVGRAAGEEHAGFAWSSDSTGLVVATSATSQITGADVGPEYSALILVDVSGGPPREIIRLPGHLSPLSWDRQGRLIAAYAASLGMFTFYVIREDGNVQITADMLSAQMPMEASPDAKLVFDRLFNPLLSPDAVRLWPVASPAQVTELRSPGSEPILAAKWRPGTTEIGVLFSDRLELWDMSGARRRVALPPLPQNSAVWRPLWFRADGSAAFIGVPIEGRQEMYSVAVDLATDRGAVLSSGPGWSPERAAFFLSVRLDP